MYPTDNFENQYLSGRKRSRSDSFSSCASNTNADATVFGRNYFGRFLAREVLSKEEEDVFKDSNGSFKKMRLKMKLEDWYINEGIHLIVSVNPVKTMVDDFDADDDETYSSLYFYVK